MISPTGINDTKNKNIVKNLKKNFRKTLFLIECQILMNLMVLFTIYVLTHLHI